MESKVKAESSKFKAQRKTLRKCLEFEAQRRISRSRIEL
jgi:hypothetical protein